MLPDLDSARSPRLWVISDSLAQPGLLLFRHLLRRTQRRSVALVCLENDPDVLLEGVDAARVDVYDGWSTVEGFDIVARLRSKPRRQVLLPRVDRLPVELLAGLRNGQHDVFIDSAPSLVESLSYVGAITVLRSILDALTPCNGRLILLDHIDALADPSTPSLSTLLLSPSLSPSLQHFIIHSSTLPRHLAHSYNIACTPDDLRAQDFLRKFHARGWGGVHYDYAERSATVEAETQLDGLGGGEGKGGAVVSWFKRMAPGGKTERGICAVKSIQGDLVWTALPTVKLPDLPTPTPHFEDVRTESQQAARDEVKLPFTPGGSGGPAIVYEADSADDFDEDEPDEELEI